MEHRCRMGWRWVLALWGVWWMGVVQAADPLPPGSHELTLWHGGMERAFAVYVPVSHRPERAQPLVLAFHGGGGSMHTMARDSLYGLLGQSESSGWIVAFPNGHSRLPGGRLATWNAGLCCGAARDKGVDDVGFARAVVAEVQRRVHIDPQRVFATGMSNGGSGSSSSTHADFVSVPATVDKWARLNRCTGPAQRVLERPGVTCEVRSDCQAGVEVRLCVTDTGGHAWPGGRKALGGKGSDALDATQAIWAFFARQ